MAHDSQDFSSPQEAIEGYLEALLQDVAEYDEPEKSEDEPKTEADPAPVAATENVKSAEKPVFEEPVEKEPSSAVDDEGTRVFAPPSAREYAREAAAQIRQRQQAPAQEQPKVDIAFQEDSVFRRNRRLVVFDMDSTLIDAEVIDELAKEAGVGEQVVEITEQAMRGEIEFTESFARRVALLKGLDEDVLAKVAARLKLTEGAERLIGTLKGLGYKTAILSGGFTYFANNLKQQLGIDYVYANELEIEGGKVTGRVTGQVVDGARKAQLLLEIAEKENIQTQQVIAVGDGANDLPMLSQAGLGVAFRAKPLVKESAEHSISTLGLDGILYLIGFRDRETE